VDISPATELSDYLDSHFHGNDKEDRGNDRGETDIGVEDINDLCPQCREELGVMDLLGFGLYGSAGWGQVLRFAFSWLPQIVIISKEAKRKT